MNKRRSEDYQESLNEDRKMTMIRNSTQNRNDMRLSGSVYTNDGPLINQNKIESLKEIDTTRIGNIVRLKTMIKDMKVKNRVKMFINKLKRNRYNKQMPRQIEREEEDLQKSAQRFEQIDNEAQMKVRKGYVLDKEIKLIISLVNFFTILYIQVISSFHCFLTEFRNNERYAEWVILSQWICLVVILIKMLSSFLVQRTVFGYRLISLERIFLYYAFSLQFMLDLCFLVSVFLLAKRRREVFPAYLAYFSSLIRLIFTQRIDQQICTHIMVSNSMRQYLALIRLLMANLFIAHFIGTIFLALADFSEDNNWMIKYGINNLSWQEKYIFSVFWAVTITSTCGFGDIVADGAHEAVVVTFVMIFGCLILSYNISQVAAIFFNLQQRQEELRKNLLLLKKVAQVSKISNKLHRSMADHIIHSSEVKFQYEMEESRNLMQRLPENLRGDYLQQSSNIFFSEMPIISLFRSQTKKLLIERLNYQILSPGEYITHKRIGIRQICCLRMGTVGLSFKKRGSTLNGLVLDRIVVDDIGISNPVLLNAFLFNRGRKQNYDIICQSFCNVAHMDYPEFIKTVKECDLDYEFARQCYDSQLTLDQEWATNICHDCNQRHSIFSCPKLVFRPYRSLIFLKNARSHRDPWLLKEGISNSIYQEYLTRYLIYLRENKNKDSMISPLKFWAKVFMPTQRVLSIPQQRFVDSQASRNDQRQFKSLLKPKKKIHNRSNELDVDAPWDFQNYFKKSNPRQLIGRELHLRKYPQLISRFSRV